MRLFSHTCSNTEIVCALGGAGLLVGVDTDSDHPAELLAGVPRLGRDLDLDVPAVLALRPDLVLTSLTVPGHERIVDELRQAGVQILVCDPRSLEDVYGDIRRIADAIGEPGRGAALEARMRTAMPPVPRARRPKVLLEWWPKPVIAPARHSWATDLIELAGGDNPWAAVDAKSTPLTDAQILSAGPDAVVMSWCGVRQENYRAEIVRRRAGWETVPAVRQDRIVPVTEAWLGRPGPRLVEGYRALRTVIDSAALD
jgi:iron complex transport system substrate-binding protein